VTEPEPTRRRLDSTGRRLVLVETAGFGLIVFALSQVYADPWRAIGALGAALIWVCQLIDRRTTPFGRR
jgi:hypothetical protein